MAIQHDFSELAVLVTGAGRGLGRSVAEKLASCGATVGLIDIDAANCEAAAARIRDAGRPGVRLRDGRRGSQLRSRRLRSRFAAERGRIDAVVNNAMLLRYEPIEKVTDEVLDRMLGIGIKGCDLGRADAARAHGCRAWRRNHQHGLARRRTRLSEHRDLQPREGRDRHADKDAGRGTRPAPRARECRRTRIGADARCDGPQ